MQEQGLAEMCEGSHADIHVLTCARFGDFPNQPAASVSSRRRSEQGDEKDAVYRFLCHKLQTNCLL